MANQAQGISTTIAGGSGNVVSGFNSSIGGGKDNQAPGLSATVSGGLGNTASGLNASVGGGGGNTASGQFAAVPGGVSNVAAGPYSFAAGANAQALHHGSFVWSDSAGAPFSSIANDEFAVRARGGVRFNSDTGNLMSLDQDRGLRVFTSAHVFGTINATTGIVIGNNPNTSDAPIWSDDVRSSRVVLWNLATLRLMDLVCSQGDVANLRIRGGADLAEPFPIKESQIEKGSVVVIDKERPGRLKQSTHAYDKRVAGIVSGANGIQPGISLKQEGMLDQGENVALTGRVYVKADAVFGAIEPGDLLTTSDTAGHAMKVLDHAQAQGAILGKAMSGLPNGKGLVLVLVTLQ
jgi:hypothetical protein